MVRRLKACLCFPVLSEFTETEIYSYSYIIVCLVYVDSSFNLNRNHLGMVFPSVTCSWLIAMLMRISTYTYIIIIYIA